MAWDNDVAIFALGNRQTMEPAALTAVKQYRQHVLIDEQVRLA